ncbi:MAG TPA: metal ABC transporter permease [Tepidisphaeraceae bacterium]|nr:metal ABC transporter permease [Tepidisphaeraceae bacterium]
MTLAPLAAADLPSALLAGTALGLACAVLSVFVILRRWALIGEGVSHSGFGGAGTAWMLAVLVPGWNTPGVVLALAVAACLGAALGIGWLGRRERVNGDAAIGIFLVASLAWGFLAASVYRHHFVTEPVGWDQFLTGDVRSVSPRFAWSAAFVCGAVVLVMAGLGKEILSYCFDPTLAQASGVRAAFVHYLMMGLIGVTVVVGMRATGTVLVPALLVLPGAAAVRVTDRLGRTFAVAIGVGVVGSVGGLLIATRWAFVPAGPAIVLVLLALFAATLLVPRRAVA